LPTHTQYPELVRSMVASRAAGAASFRRREWPSVRGGQWVVAHRRHRHLSCQGRPRSALELWETWSDLGVGAKRRDRRDRRQILVSSSTMGEREE